MKTADHICEIMAEEALFISKCRYIRPLAQYTLSKTLFVVEYLESNHHIVLLDNLYTPTQFLFLH
jgi:hypothetical protein